MYYSAWQQNDATSMKAQEKQATTYPYRLLEDEETLASFKGWDEDVYRDFFRLQRREMTEAEFLRKYQRECAILSMDLTGFVRSAIQHGDVHSLLRILDMQKLAIPALHDFGPELIRCFADDIVALFEDVNTAVDAAFEVHRRIRLFNESGRSLEDPPWCCAGIGFGSVLAIGPNLAQGDEMNRASRLGEDIARGNETLVTEKVYAAIAHRDDIDFELRDEDDLLFPFYRITPIA
jgi:class 3 adenylate cyclase